MPSLYTASSSPYAGKPPVKVYSGVSNRQQKQIRFPHRVFQKEHILELNLLERTGLQLKETFIETPKSIVKGLTGNPEYNFGDFLRTGKVPYYLGGAFLTMVFAAGGGKMIPLQQGVGVLLYYLGVSAGNKMVDTAVKAKYGLDLNLKYKKHSGEVENVFTSPVFSRYDLVTDGMYEHMRAKMGIPEFVADPVGEVQKNIQNLIPAVRTGKIIFSTMLAAFGAGYLARSDAWTKLLGGFNPLKKVLSGDSSVLNKLANGLTLAGQTIKTVFQEKILGKGVFAKTSPTLRRFALGLVAATGIYSLWQINNATHKKEFEAPGFGMKYSQKPLNAPPAFSYFLSARKPNFSQPQARRSF